MNDPNTKLAALQALWAKDPILGISSLFGVTPDEQQTELILSAANSGSRIAVKSCQGAGKTATLVWLVYYFLLTLPDCRILVTSPSYQQLGRVFNTELEKWRDRMPPLFKGFFEVTKEQVRLKSKPYQAAHLVTASAENKESLQGGHSENYIILADEASGIDEEVFDLLQGTLGTGSGGRFIMTSNPVRNSGRFYEIFTDEDKGKVWKTITFTAENSTQVNPQWVSDMESFYGTDSDIYKVRVLAKFPMVSESQFISSDAVDKAMSNYLEKGEYSNFEKVCGVDVARFGSDRTVLTLRQGPKLLDITTFEGLDTMEVASKVVEYYRDHSPTIIYVDAIGIGAGVFDRCRQLSLPVVEVVVSGKSSDPKQYYNLRSQLWGELRNWLANGADIPNNKRLRSQLLSMTYGYNNKLQVQLTSKKDIKKQGLESPDIPDSIALTFAGETYTYSPRSRKSRGRAKVSYCWA